MIYAERMEFVRPFSLNPVQVVPPESEGPWLVDYDIPTWQVYCLLYSQPQEGDTCISFAEAYRLRWLEQAHPDSKGQYFLMNTRSVRTPLHLWAKERGYFIYFKAEEITFPKPIELPL